MRLLPPIQVYEEPPRPMSNLDRINMRRLQQHMNRSAAAIADHSLPDFGPSDPIGRYLSETFLATATKTEAVKRMAEHLGMKL